MGNRPLSGLLITISLPGVAPSTSSRYRGSWLTAGSLAIANNVKANANRHFIPNLHFGFSGPIQYKPNRRSLMLPVVILPPGSHLRYRKAGLSPGNPKPGKYCVFSAFHKHFYCSHTLVTLISLCPSPASTSSPPAGHPSAAPCSQTVAWSDGSRPASASSTAACLIRRPPVFTSLCSKLVSNQFSIFFGNTNRRDRFPALYASTRTDED